LPNRTTDAKKNFLRKGEGIARFGMKRLHLKKRSSQIPQKVNISVCTKLTNLPGTQNKIVSETLPSGTENFPNDHDEPLLFSKV